MGRSKVISAKEAAAPLIIEGEIPEMKI